jgi:hypothetical protein
LERTAELPEPPAFKAFLITLIASIRPPSFFGQRVSKIPLAILCDNDRYKEPLCKHPRFALLLVSLALPAFPA